MCALKLPCSSSSDSVAGPGSSVTELKTNLGKITASNVGKMINSKEK